MNLKFKCAQCRTPLDLMEVHCLPGENIYDKYTGWTFNATKKLCRDCYKRFTYLPKKKNYQEDNQEKVLKKNKKSFTLLDIPLHKIRDLKPNQNNVNILVIVEKKGDKKEIKKDTRKIYLSETIVNDETGEIQLKLWNDIIDKINQGDILLIENGFISEFRGTKTITLGRQGKLRKINE